MFNQGGSLPALGLEEAEADPFLEKDPEAGVSIRAIGALFRQIDQQSVSHSHVVKVGLVEIYNEKIRDLLHGAHSELGADLMQPFHSVSASHDCGAHPKGDHSEKTNTPECKVRVSKQGNVSLEGMSEVTAARAGQVLQLLRLGQSRRAVCATAMNAESSRSHLALFVRVQGTEHRTGMVTSSKLCLCDLAGSERVGKSQATGQQLKEAQGINQSLSALGNVMQSLQSKGGHIPYRNSKLTHMLSDMLGGKAKVATIVQISPAASNIGESTCTLQFGERVGQITLGAAKKAVLERRASTTTLDEQQKNKLEAQVQGAEARAAQLEEELAEVRVEVEQAHLDTIALAEQAEMIERDHAKQNHSTALEREVRQLKDAMKRQEIATKNQMHRMKGQIKVAEKAKMVAEDKQKHAEQKPNAAILNVQALTHAAAHKTAAHTTHRSPTHDTRTVNTEHIVGSTTATHATTHNGSRKSLVSTLGAASAAALRVKAHRRAMEARRRIAARKASKEEERKHKEEERKVEEKKRLFLKKQNHRRQQKSNTQPIARPSPRCAQQKKRQKQTLDATQRSAP